MTAKPTPEMDAATSQEAASNLAERLLLAPSDMDTAALEATLGQALTRDADDADLYLEHSTSEAWSLEDSKVKQVARSIDRGFGLRLVKGDRAAIANSTEIKLPQLRDAAKTLSALDRQGQADATVSLANKADNPRLYPALLPAEGVPDSAKVALLSRLDERARAADARVSQVMLGLVANANVVLVARKDGLVATDVRPLVRLNVSVVVEQGSRRERAVAGAGGRYPLERILQGDLADHLVDDACRRALINLDSVPAPAGPTTVVLGPGWPGILLHEAIGHGLEGDFNRKGTSAFAGKLGQRIAVPGCTVVDDGTLADRRGSLNFDDEGTPSRCTTLIDDGILVAYLCDRMNGRLMGTGSTGNGRRQSYAHRPMPRMTNTYMQAGDVNPDVIIASVKDGVYASTFGGGQVDTTSGKFVFTASEAYRIRDGKLGEPLKGATLIGDGVSVLKNISMIGNDLELDLGIGTCGKEGQQVPVGVGQPTLRIDNLTVGGTG